MLLNEKNKKTTSLGGKAVLLTLTKIVTLCITMATSMLLSRFRSFEEYGTYSQLLLIVNLISAFFMLGLPNSINYFLARAETKEEKRNFLSVYYSVSTLLSLLVGVVLVCGIPIFERYFSNPLLSRYYYFLALYPWATIIASGIENILIVFERTRTLVAFQILRGLFTLSSVILVQAVGWGFDEYMMVYLAVCIACAIFVYGCSSYLTGGLRVSFDPLMIKSIFAFSVPMGLSVIVGTLDIEIDKLLIGYLMNTEQLAIYTNAARELPLTVAATSITAVLLPQLTRMIKGGDKRDAVELWGHAVRLSFVFMCFFVAGVFTYAEDVMTILYSAKYLPGVSVFRVYTLILLLRCTYFGIILNACGRSRLIFRCSLAALVLNVILNPLLFRMFGMVGPAIATFLSILIINMVQLAATAKETAVPFRKVFPWGSLGGILGVNLVLAVVFFILKRALPLDAVAGSVAESVALGVVWGIVYLMIMKKKIMIHWRKLK